MAVVIVFDKFKRRQLPALPQLYGKTVIGNIWGENSLSHGQGHIHAGGCGIYPGSAGILQ
jgi:hypothetical protein